MGLFEPLILPALLAGAYYLSSTLAKPDAPEVTRPVDTGQRQNETFEAENAPEQRAVGRVRRQAHPAFGRTRADDRYRLGLIVKDEIDGYETFYFSGREVVVASTGAVGSFPWAEGGQWAYLKTKSGTDSETAWTDLTSAFAGIWTSDHRVRGIAQVLAHFISPGLSNPFFLSLYQGGVPEVEVVLRAEKAVYDPRIIASQWTENGVLNALHILLTYPEFTQSAIDMAFIEDEADRADELIETKAGNVARSRCWGVWSSETPRGTNMQTALDSIGAWIISRPDNKIALQLIDDDPTSELTIAAKNIVDISFRSGPEGVERPNVCRVKYYSPERNFKLAEIDMSGVAWARIDDEITAYGEKPYDVDLPFCPNAGQAQRRARQMFELARADSGVIRTNQAGKAAWGCKIVSFEFPDDIGTLKTRIEPPRVLDDEGLVEIPFVVWPTLDAWDPDVHEAAAPDQLPDIPYGDPITTPTTPSVATVVTYQVGGSATRVTYAMPIDADGVEVVYRTYTSGKPDPWRPMTEYESATGVLHAYVGLDLAGLKADFRLRTFDTANENSSLWSGTFAVATLAVNNAAPSAPTIVGVWTTGSGAALEITVTVASSLQVAYLTLTGAGAPTIDDIRPGDQVIWTDVDSTGDTYTATAKSTNGTASATRTLKSAHDIEGQTTIRALYRSGTGTITVSWHATDGGGAIDEVDFTGTSSPANEAITGTETGSWTASVGAGTHVFTIQGKLAGVNVGSAASVSITIP